VGWDISYSLAEPPSDLFDFTVMSPQDPLSAGGVLTNNTQGTGGNVAMNAQSSMRVIAAASGGGNIAAGDSLGQSDPFDYLDSFAFAPGHSGNIRVTAVMYADSGYTPPGHELELLLGCSSAAGTRTWISCTWDRGGVRIMALMNGGPSGYTILSPNDAGAGGLLLATGDVWVAELYRTSNIVITKRNGAEILNSSIGGSAAANAAAIAVATGNGGGIGCFRRTLAPSDGTAANRYGFQSMQVETF
jgi:hypothetical protein